MTGQGIDPTIRILAETGQNGQVRAFARTFGESVGLMGRGCGQGRI